MQDSVFVFFCNPLLRDVEYFLGDSCMRGLDIPMPANPTLYGDFHLNPKPQTPLGTSERDEGMRVTAKLLGASRILKQWADLKPE